MDETSASIEDHSKCRVEHTCMLTGGNGGSPLSKLWGVFYSLVVGGGFIIACRWRCKRRYLTRSRLV